MAAVITVTSAEVKDFLGITVLTYDTQVDAVVAQFTESIEAKLVTSYLTDATAAVVIKLGKVMIIAGWTAKLLPAAATGLGTGERTRKTAGAYTVETESTSSSLQKSGVAGAEKLIADGWDTLKPYLAADAAYASLDTVSSTTEDYEPEFVLERKDSEGSILVEESEN